MKHLGSVIIGETFNIFFQWADLNLEQFFDDELRPAAINRDMITPKNLLRESTWLASALEYLHTQLLDEDGKAVHCCHMDLKPDNILVMVRSPAFPLGKWKIADFGISNIEPRSMSVSIRDFYARTTTTRPGTRPAAVRSLRYPGPFQPPEAESAEKAMYATKKDFNDLKGDIWSFGCILLVVLVFATGGTPYVDELANRRQVHEIDFDGQSRTGFFYRKVMGPPQIMPAIVRLISPLARTQGVWFGKAWSFISRHMLVADPANRVDADVVRHSLYEWMGIAEPRNIWNEAPDLKSFSPLTLAGPEQQLERFPGQNVQRSMQTPTVSPILEYSEPPTPMTTVLPAEQGGIFSPTTTLQESQGYSPGSETTSPRSSTSNRSGSSGPVGNLSQDLSKEKLVVISSDGQKIAFANRGRAKIFSKRSDDVAVFSKEIVQNIESRPTSKWEQVHFAGPVIALRDQETLNVSELGFCEKYSLLTFDDAGLLPQSYDRACSSGLGTQGAYAGRGRV
jgi:serine/threonine protein kinase